MTFCQIFALFFITTISLVQASVVAVPTVEVLQGPSSKTTVLGPDGSALNAAAPGGTVVTSGTGLLAAGPAILPAAGPPTVVAGPAGSISTVNTIAGPAVVPALTAAVAPAAVNVGVKIAPILLGDIETPEGKYIPDNTELLHDDGSYKGE